MITPFVIYNRDGNILRAGVSPDVMVVLQPGAGEFVLSGVTGNGSTQYVDTATLQVVTKPPLGATPDKTTALANSTDVVTISGLPNPTTARVTGPGVNQTATVADGSLELTFAAPGEYRVRLSALHRLDQEVVINAT